MATRPTIKVIEKTKVERPTIITKKEPIISQTIMEQAFKPKQEILTNQQKLQNIQQTPQGQLAQQKGLQGVSQLQALKTEKQQLEKQQIQRPTLTLKTKPTIEKAMIDKAIQNKIDKLDKQITPKQKTSIESTIAKIGADIGTGFLGTAENIADLVLTATSYGAKKLGADELSNILKGASQIQMTKNITDPAQKLYSKESAIKKGSFGEIVGQAVGGVLGLGTVGKALGTASKIGIIPTAPILSGVGASTVKGLDKGKSLETSLLYGIPSGVVSGITEALSGGIGGVFGKGAVDDLVINRVSNLFSSKLAQKLTTLTGKAAFEGIEENIEGLIDPYLQRLTIDEKAKLYSGDEAVMDFLVGATASAILQTPGINNIQVKPTQQANKPIEKEEKPQITKPTETLIKKTVEQKPKETTTNKIIEIDNEQYELNDAKNIKRVNIGTDFYRNIRNLFKEESANKITGDFDKAKLNYVKQNNEMANDLKTNIVDKYNIQKGSKDSALVQQYGEGIITLEQLKQQSPTKWKEIIEADKYFRNKYNDFIDNINNARKEIYPNVEKNITEYEMKLQKTNDNIIAKQKELQSINKNTTKYQDTKNQIKNLELRAKSYQDILDSDELLLNKRIPKRKDYYRHFQEMAEGFAGLQNILSTTADISPKMVGISDFTKPKTKFSSIAQQRKGNQTKYDSVGGFLNYIPTANYMINIDKQISKMRTLTNELRKQMGDDTSANKAIEFLTEWTNNLAGKQTFVDRAAQKVIGRKAIKGINWTVGRIKANMIVGNVSSSLSQVLNFPQIVGNIKNPIHLTNGFKDMLNKNTDYSKSQFITERYKTDIMSQFETEMLDKPKKLAKFMIEVLDEKTTKLGWNAAYRQAIEKGIKNPIQYADNTMRDLVAGRGIGEKTIFQESKVINAIMPFTVEVGNLTRVMKDFGRKKDILGLFISFIMANLVNDAVKKLGGGGSTFDPIDAIKDSLTEEDLTILERIGRIGGEVLSNIPLGQQLATIYPEYGVKSATGKQILPTRTKLFGDNDPTRFGTGGIISKVISNPLTSIITPYGGGQLEKIRKGYEIISKGGEYKNGKLKYPVEKTTLNTLRALTMGNTKETTEFYEKDRRILSEKQTKEIEQSPNIKAAYENMMKVREYKSLLTKYKELQGIGKDTTEVENKIKKLFEK